MVLGDVLTRDSGNAAWNVMVQRRRLGWRVAGGPLAEVELAVPPRIIIGVVNADAFADAVFWGRFARKVEHFCCFMRQRARISLAVREADDDAKNRRLMAWQFPQLVASGCLSSFLTCVLHQNNMIIGASIGHVGRSLIDGLYAWSKLLREGNYWTRTVLVVQHVVAEELVINHGQPPPQATAARDLVMALFFRSRGPGLLYFVVPSENFRQSNNNMI